MTPFISVQVAGIIYSQEPNRAADGDLCTGEHP